MAVKRMRGATLEERFWARTNKAGPDECWLWNASLNSRGYGNLAHGKGFV